MESGLKTSDQLAFNSLAENFKKTEENDSTGFFSLSNFQKWMVNDIKFNKDNDYYKVLVKESLDKSGLDLQDMELKDHNRYEAYARMICSLGLDYYVSYPVDKRYGEISNHYFTTIYDCDMLMVSVLKIKYLPSRILSPICLIIILKNFLFISKTLKLKLFLQLLRRL